MAACLSWLPLTSCCPQEHHYVISTSDLNPDTIRSRDLNPETNPLPVISAQVMVGCLPFLAAVGIVLSSVTTRMAAKAQESYTKVGSSHMSSTVLVPDSVTSAGCQTLALSLSFQLSHSVCDHWIQYDQQPNTPHTSVCLVEPGTIAWFCCVHSTSFWPSCISMPMLISHCCTAALKPHHTLQTFSVPL